MQHTVSIRKRLFSRSSDWEIGEGATVNLNVVSKPLTTFLRNEYIKDPSCLYGNVKLLFNLKDQDFEKMTECEYWEV